MTKKLTPFEEVLYQALQATPEGVSYEILAALKVPEKKVDNPRNKFAVHMMTLRKKLGVKIESVQDFGYRLINK